MTTSPDCPARQSVPVHAQRGPACVLPARCDECRTDLAADAAAGVASVKVEGSALASHLKRRTLHWAALNGLEEIYTWTQAGNSSMLRLNEHLGYVTTRNGITVSRTLPLTN